MFTCTYVSAPVETNVRGISLALFVDQKPSMLLLPLMLTGLAVHCDLLKLDKEAIQRRPHCLQQ
jgi:hypothetical protein